MIVYHGSITEVKYPDVEHSYRNLDFGQGFYVTTVREQAERWAKWQTTKSTGWLICIAEESGRYID